MNFWIKKKLLKKSQKESPNKRSESDPPYQENYYDVLKTCNLTGRHENWLDSSFVNSDRWDQL